MSVGCAQRAHTQPPTRVVPPPGPHLSESCNAAERLRQEAHERVARGQFFAANRRLAAADRLCAASAASADAALTSELLTLAVGETSQELLDEARTAQLQGEGGSQALLEDRAALLLEQSTGSLLGPRLPSALGEGTDYEWTSDSEWLLARSADGISLRRRDEWYPRFQTAEHGSRLSGDELRLSADGASLLALEGNEATRERWVSLIDVTPSEKFGRSRARFAVTGYPPPALSADSARLVLAEPSTFAPEHSVLTVVTAATGAVERRIEPPAGATGVSSLELGQVGHYALVRWSDDSLSVVELATGKAWHHAGKTAIADEPFSPDERFVIFGDFAFRDAHHAVVYDTSSGRARPLALGTCSLTGNLVYDSGSQLAALGSFDGELCLVQPASGKLRKLRLKTPVGMALPRQFLYGTKGLILSNRDGGLLLDVASGRLLATFPDLMGPLRVGEQPTVLSPRGTFSSIDAQLTVHPVDPQPRPSTPISMATSIGPEVALLFDSGWLIAHGATGATRSFDFPPSSEPPPNESPDAAFLAFTAGSAPEIYSTISGKRAARSPRSFDTAGASAWTTALPAPSKSTKTACSSEHLRDPSGQVQLVRQDDGHYLLRDCASGSESAVPAMPSFPTDLLSPTRALLSSQRGDLVVWDLRSAESVGHVPWELNNANVYALSADDRYLFAANTLWALRSSEPLLKLDYQPAQARFLGNDALLTSRGVRVDVWRAPRFAHSGAAFSSRDGTARILFALDLQGNVTALETRGAANAWDTTFGCGAGVFGVPFRVCREALERSGVFRDLLE